ncbi:LCP family protein [Rubrobacter aplysinae]|uniref:LCP family protein n=1 Tax=Rubrobacter aplysinae TaxID=909625 RepID=UPI00069D50EB|nr:LCP family protein [Rubrobacter aplysinae]
MRDFGEFTSSGNSGGSSPPRRHDRALLLIVVVFVVFAGTTLTAFGTFGTFSGRETSGGQDPEGEASAQTPGDTDATNILLMGLDGGKDPEDSGTQRADTLMLARLQDTGRVSLLSIPRDLYVEDMGPGGEPGRINSAYAYGGAERTVGAVEDFTGVPVDHYVSADFKGFRETVDALGGVRVRVQKDYLAKRGIPRGEQVLDGKEALLYARYRKTPEGDLGRIRRQQQILAALKSQVLSWEAIGSSPGIVRSLSEHVETDMGAPRMISLGRALARHEEGGMDSDQLEGRPVTLSDGRQVLVPEDQRNAEILYDFLR